jgi:hypothetical protein
LPSDKDIEELKLAISKNKDLVASHELGLEESAELLRETVRIYRQFENIFSNHGFEMTQIRGKDGGQITEEPFDWQAFDQQE